jgi:hypothetical protein
MTQYATPPRFGTQPIEGYSADLAQITLEDALADPAALFDTPPPMRRPILALIQCRVCGKESRIPILADAKICASCSADLPATKTRIETALDAATDRSFNAELDLHALIADAGEQTLARYQNAVALREANDPRIAAAWAKALAAGDALAALLAAHDAQVATTAALTRLLAHSEVALAEIARLQFVDGYCPPLAGH